MDLTNNPNEIFILIGFAYFIAGIVKGIIGIGLPTTAITIMTFFISPLVALGLNLIPMTVSNIWQFSRADNPKKVMQNYKYFAFFLVFFIGGESLLMALGGEGSLLEESLLYIKIFLTGAIFIWLSGTLSAALRGIGNMRFPALLMIAGSGIQVILALSLIHI